MAAEPRFSLYSLDDIIVESSGMSIPRMVQDFGWRHFREVEFEVCKRVALLCDRGWCLIDAGGGVVVDLDDDGDASEVVSLGSSGQLPLETPRKFWISER